MPLPPDELLAEARRARDEAERLIEYAKMLETAAAMNTGLTPTRIKRNVSSMQVQGDLSSDTKRAASRATSTHPGQRQLYEQNVSIAKLARELGETRARVSSWFGSGLGNRPIPRRFAEMLRDRYGIQLDVWARIAD
jgi:hypothetical protein